MILINKMETITICIILGIIIIGLGIGGLMIVFIDIDLYFLNFNFNNHPKLLMILENTLQNICDEEGIKVFHKTYEEININVTDENKKSLGKYIYSINQEYQQTLDKLLVDIEELEIKYKMSYKELCEFVGYKTVGNKENFILPRILLCDIELKKLGIGSYYYTFFHELGHHFAIKTMGMEHSENDADKYGYMLMMQRLPYYFQLFFYFRDKSDKEELTGKEKLKGYISYLKYLIKKN